MSIQYTADQLQRKFGGAPGSAGFARIADGLRGEGRLDEAVALCQEGLRQKPGYLTGYLVLGKCLFDLGRFEEAREQFEAVLRTDPRCLAALHWLARIMTRLQWPDAAAAYYRSILDLEPWDTEALARFRELSPGGSPAAAFAPPAPKDDFSPASEPPAQPGLSPFAPADTASPAPEVEEFDLNKVADFLPAESNPAELTGALQEVSLEDALSAPPREADVAIPPMAPPEPPVEPRPLDVLTPEAAGPAIAEPEAPAPISGDDVEARLDSLFGVADDQPVVKHDPAESGLDEATLLLGARRTQERPGLEAPPEDSAPEARGDAAPFASSPFAAESPEDPAPEAAADASAPEARVFETPVLDAGESPTETAVFNGSELLAPGDRVSGEDIEQRLDALFALADEAPARAATPVAPEAEAVPEPSPFAPAPKSDFSHAPAADARVASGTTALPAEEDIAGLTDLFAAPAAAETPAEPVAEPTASADLLLAPDPGTAEMPMSPDDLVTGQDVSDKLEALFGSEPQARREPAVRPEPEAAPAPESSPFDLPASGSASWAAARASSEEPLVESAAPAAGEPAPFELDALREVPEAGPAGDLEAGSDVLSTESMLPRSLGRDSAPAITGDDIEDRLDSLFNLGDEPAAAAPAAPAAEAEAGSDPESPFAGTTAAEPEPGEADRTVVMPAMKETAADWLARQGDAPAESDAAPEIPRAEDGPSPFSAAASGSETLILPVEEDATAAGAAPAPGDGLLSDAGPVVGGVPGAGDTVGLEMVEGEDIAARLDQLFAEPEAPATAAPSSSAGIPPSVARSAAEATAAGSQAQPELPALESAELPADEVTLFAQDPEATLPAPDSALADAGAPMLSGEDISSRLSEIFETPAPEAPSAGVGTAIQPLVDEAADESMPPLRDAGPAPAAAEPAAPTPSAVSEAPAGHAAPALSPLLDDEEGYPEEENAPQSAAGANVATVTLAEIYFQQGLREQALQIYRQLLEREPGNESVRKRIQEIEASKPEAGGPGQGPDPRRPRPGLKVPKRKK